MDNLLKGLLYFLFFILGVIIFSFVNMIIYKLPEKKVFAKEKSACRACGHEFAFKDLIPVISWIRLKGKCRYCGAKISVRDMVVELLGGAFAVGLTVYYGVGLKALTIFLFFAMLTIVTCIDMDTMEIPFVLNVIILVLGIISIWTVGGVSILERIIGLFCISLPLFLIVLVIPEGFGGGDIKLMFAAGMFLGWKATVVAFLIGLLLGGGYGVVCLIRRKHGKKDHFAFGPFLSVGLAIAVFCGTQLMDMYLEILKRSFMV